MERDNAGDRSRDIGFMRLALEQAQQAAKQGEVPVGAVVVIDDRVISRGANRTRRDGVVYAHAELVALGAAEQAVGDYRLDNAELYVTVEPCMMCLGAILQARIKRLVYGAAEPKFGALRSRFQLGQHPALRKLVISSGVLADDAAELLGAFFRDLREHEEDSS